MIMKNNKGITLIALVITIIVLLILAGVSIAMLTGDNGILTKASQAGSDTTSSQLAELINVELNDIYAETMAINAGTGTARTGTTTRQVTYKTGASASISVDQYGNATVTVTGPTLHPAGGITGATANSAGTITKAAP